MSDWHLAKVVYDCFIETGILVILIIEFFYDKKVTERRINRTVQSSRRKVVVEVENGIATCTSKPKGIDIVIHSKGAE